MGENAILGLCSTGFFFLAGWCWYLNSKMSGALDLAAKVDEIHKALLGDMKNEGLISKQRRMEEKCNMQHPKVLQIFALVFYLLGICTLANACM